MLPRKYLDLRSDQLITTFSDLPDGEKCILYGELTEFEVHRNTVPSRTVAKLIDDCGNEVSATFFGDPRLYLSELEDKLYCKVCLAGTIGYFKQFAQLKNPSIIDSNHVGFVVPVYPGKTKVISPETVFEHLQLSLLPVTIPMAAQWLRQKLRWSSETEVARLSTMPGLGSNPKFEALLNAIHIPSSVKEGLHAIKFLKLIATYDVLSGSRAETFHERNIQSEVHIPPQKLTQLLSETVLRPTDEQRQVIDEICTDIASDNPMLRLLSADVGFGKTYVAAAAGAAVVRNRGSVVWLCPNQPLAVQTSDNIAGWWPNLAPGLVIGDSSEIPDAKFLIGTTALHHRLPKGFHPDLLIIDESQKFGQLQKDELAGPATNILNATATCIPRTAALLEWGGMAVSRLTKSHVQKEIKTRLVLPKYRQALFESIKRNILAGHQALIIYPLAETKEEAAIDRKSAEGAYELWNRHFPGRVRYMHGKIKDEEKLSAIAAMRNDEADILISTIAVETGIDLPRLRHVAIVHPERLGLNTLHQIRGRVARRGGIGRCDLFLPKEVGEDSIKHLEILVKFSDGLDVATENMKLQGFGDLGTDGTAQSGRSLSFIPGHKLDHKEVEWVAERWLNFTTDFK
ncbi:MAG: DEAD/DEAH box helicase family protein [Methylomonas sp.]|nr:DEAD/DEAH box helicase family protein [Methylomonas sp.]